MLCYSFFCFLLGVVSVFFFLRGGVESMSSARRELPGVRNARGRRRHMHGFLSPQHHARSSISAQKIFSLAFCFRIAV
jgi:hypothetical protein